MLYNQAEDVQAKLDDAFPLHETTLTRLARTADTPPDAANEYRVAVELQAPLGAEELGKLVNIAGSLEHCDLNLETGGPTGTSAVAAFQ